MRDGAHVRPDRDREDQVWRFLASEPQQDPVTRVLLHETRLDLIRSIYPPAKGIRLLGVTVSVFEAEDVADLAQLGLQLGAIV